MRAPLITVLMLLAALVAAYCYLTADFVPDNMGHPSVLLGG